MDIHEKIKQARENAGPRSTIHYIYRGKNKWKIRIDHTSHTVSKGKLVLKKGPKVGDIIQHKYEVCGRKYYTLHDLCEDEAITAYEANKMLMSSNYPDWKVLEKDK